MVKEYDEEYFNKKCKMSVNYMNDTYNIEAIRSIYKDFDREWVYAFCKCAVFLHKYTDADPDWWYDGQGLGDKKETISLKLWLEFTHYYYLLKVFRIYQYYNIKTIEELYKQIELTAYFESKYYWEHYVDVNKVSSITAKDWF